MKGRVQVTLCAPFFMSTKCANIFAHCFPFRDKSIFLPYSVAKPHGNDDDTYPYDNRGKFRRVPPLAG